MSDESETTLWQIWKDYNIYKAIKNHCFAWYYGHHHEWGLEEPWSQSVQDFHGFEKVDEESKKVFSNLVTLSKMLELKLQEDDFTELLTMQHEEFNNEDLMELGVQRKDEKRQGEITKKLERFMMK